MAAFAPQQSNATINGLPISVRSSRLNLLQLRKRINDVAARLGQLELCDDGEWPLEDSRFSRSTWPSAASYSGLAALYLASMPSRGSADFKAWYGATIFRNELGVKRGKQDKSNQIELQRLNLIERVRIRWDGEAKEVFACLELSDGDSTPKVVQSAFASARDIHPKPGETRRLEHKRELLRTVYAFKRALRALQPEGGILQLEVFIQKSLEKWEPGITREPSFQP